MPTLIEFLIALGGNIASSFFLITLILFILTVMLVVYSFACYEESNNPHRNSEYQEKYNQIYQRDIKWLKFTIPLLLFSFFITNMPTINDLWKVRIALIKFQLASPENIQKGTDVIERIGQKLECKYIGTNCEEKKK